MASSTHLTQAERWTWARPLTPAQSRPAARPPTLTKADQARLDDTVARELEAQTAGIRAELTKVESDLAVALAGMPGPSPVLVRKAAQPSREREAADLRAKAYDLRRDDPTAARGYLDQAAELLRKG